MTTLLARSGAALLLALAPLCGGCSDKLPMDHRSGPAADDNVEEPLAEDVKPYENALRVANSVLELVKAGDTKSVYEQYLDPRQQQKATAEQFAGFLKAPTKQYGPMLQFKPMQWGFAHRKGDGMKLLYVTKIVEHANGLLAYHFQFEDDGKYAKLTGVTMLPHKVAGPPGPP